MFKSDEKLKNYAQQMDRSEDEKVKIRRCAQTDKSQSGSLRNGWNFAIEVTKAFEWLVVDELYGRVSPTDFAFVPAVDKFGVGTARVVPFDESVAVQPRVVREIHLKVEIGIAQNQWKVFIERFEPVVGQIQGPQGTFLLVKLECFDTTIWELQWLQFIQMQKVESADAIESQIKVEHVRKILEYFIVENGDVVFT